MAIDTTHTYMHKSSNFRILAQSYPLHKNEHLFNSAVILAPDGYFLAIFLSYYDYQNNYTEILYSEFERNAFALRDWF